MVSLVTLVTLDAHDAALRSAGTAQLPESAPQRRSILGRVTLTGALLAVAVMSGIYSAAFSAYWLILTLFALGGATQTWSFDLVAGNKSTQAE